MLFYYRGKYRFTSLRNGDYRGQEEKNRVIKKLEFNTPTLENKDISY